MKNKIFNTGILVLCCVINFNIAYAQNDSLKNNESDKTTMNDNSDTAYSVEDCSYSYIITGKTGDSLKGKIRNYVFHKKFEDISLIVINKNGDLNLLNSSGESVSSSLKYAEELRITTGSNTGIGIIAGTVVGALVGLGIGAVTDNNCTDNSLFHMELGKPFGAGIGALIGGIVGGVIGNQAKNEDVLELKLIKENERQKELMKFLNNQR